MICPTLYICMFNIYIYIYIWKTQIDVQSLIDVHSSNQRPLTSLSQFTVRFKGILRSMADLLLSNQRPFQSEDLYLLLACHMMDVGQVCTSCELHIISNECKTFKIPSINSVHLTRILSNKKAHQWPSYLSKFENKI